jgi:beta-propeller repeat-containing protein
MRANIRRSVSTERRLLIVLLSLFSLAAGGAFHPTPSSAASATEPASPGVLGATVEAPASSLRAMRALSDVYGHLPVSFEANNGQTDPRVKFLSRGRGNALFLTPTEAVFVVGSAPQPRQSQLSNERGRETQGGGPGAVLRMAFVGASPTPRVVGRDELPGKANYFVGNDRAKWRTNVPTYARVHYEQLYPGIDVVYYDNQRQLEYDFVIGPGADPNKIVLSFLGADSLEVDAQGDLVIHTAAGAIRQRKPVIHQEVNGVRQEIAGGYVVKGARLVSFRVAAYDASRPLVIDPVLFYSTYLGGSADDQGNAIAVDTAGNAYVTGTTSSANFPTTAGAFQPTFRGGVGCTGFLNGPTDVVVAKVSPTGSGLVYSTYLGGSTGSESGLGIAVDTLGNAYVAGGTCSTDFPTTAGAFQTTYGGGNSNGFVTKLNAVGSGLVYSTYLGVSSRSTAIATDAVGDAYVTGITNSTSFPTTAGAFPTTYGGGGSDGFVTKLNPLGTALVYSTYLGGNGDEGTAGIAVDTAGNAYVTGDTLSSNFPTTPGAFQTVRRGISDVFVTKLNPTGTGLVYSTLLGGSGGEDGLAIAIDAAGNAYVTGDTNSTDFPTVFAFQPAFGGGVLDAFVAKLNPIGTGLVYSTYLGGVGFDRGLGVAVDTAGNAYVTGFTGSTNFPTVSAFQPTFGGGSFDAFVTVVNPSGMGLIYSTYLGGIGDDFANGITIDTLPSPNVYVAGSTSSTNFPTTTGGFQTSYGGGPFDAFVAKITQAVLPPPPTVGKVTGGGTVTVSGGIANFGFIVQAQSTSGPIGGDLQYVNHASGAKVHSVMFTDFVISGDMATFGGTCTNNGVLCTFTVNVIDDDQSGTGDSFTITVDAGPMEGGPLRHGDIEIHQ